VEDPDTTSPLSIDTGGFPQSYNSVIVRGTIGGHGDKSYEPVQISVDNTTERFTSRLRDGDSLVSEGGVPYWKDYTFNISHLDAFWKIATHNDIGDSGLGKPAIVTWRSQGASDEQTIPVQIMRVPSDEIERVKSGLTDPMETWIEAATPEDDTFIAWLDKCTHFCCVPQYKGLSGSANFGAENDVYCQCHQSVYDPFSPIEKQFTAFPRPTQ